MGRAPAGQPKESGQIQAKCSAVSRGGGTPHPREASIRLLWGLCISQTARSPVAASLQPRGLELGWVWGGLGAGRVLWNVTSIPALDKALYSFAWCWLMVELSGSVPVGGLGAPGGAPCQGGRPGLRGGPRPFWGY